MHSAPSEEWRFSCEDAYQAAPGLDGDPTRGIFFVFDGHGGREAADYAADNLHNNILREVNDVGSHLDHDKFMKQVKAAMIKGFLATDQEFYHLEIYEEGQLPRQHTFAKAEYG